MQSRGKVFKKVGSPNASARLAYARRSYATKTTHQCPLESCTSGDIDYKNRALLVKFVSNYGRILPSRITSTSAKKQRKLARAIKRARGMGIMPYHGAL